MTVRIGWFEVMAQDRAKAEAFYAEVLGWRTQTPEGMDYAMVQDAGDVGGGIGQAPEGTGWSTFYVVTDDLDGVLARATARGGRVLMPAYAMPDGRIAVFADPEGHAIGLFEPEAA